MPTQAIAIRTADGIADAHVCHPDGAGPWPGVILFMDAMGIRPELIGMAEQLAGAGYYVLLPNLYYRHGENSRVDTSIVFTDKAEADRMMSLYASLTSDLVTRDTEAYLDHLSSQGEVRGSRFGTTGYCMGGGISLNAAGRFPDRVAAACAFHGAMMATDRPDSPHLLADRMKAKIYVGVAEIDPFLFAGETERLEQELKAAGVVHQIEIYKGVNHGFAVPGLAVYDEAAAKQHWDRLLGLFGSTL